MGGELMSTSSRRIRGVAVAVLVLAISGMSALVVGVPAQQAGDAPPADLPGAMHGAVETQAVTAGIGALSLLVDPGTAYAYSTIDRDDYGGGSVSYTMTARGANLNLGTIALAVLWAAPSCEPEPNPQCVLSGGDVAEGDPAEDGREKVGGPNTGLHEAGGFPAYAEALYPPPPEESGQPSRETVYKCVVNKDAAGGGFTDGAAQDVCKDRDEIPMTAWATAVGKEYRSFGFSRAGGFDVPDVIHVGASESTSEVKHAGGGKVLSEGLSTAEDISIAGGQIRIASSSATGRVFAGAGDPGERSAACTFSGLTIGGEPVSPGELEAGDAQPLLDGVEQGTGFRVEIIPPAAPVTEVREGGKHVAECTGLKVNITDVRPGSPVPVCAPPVDPNVPPCVPGLGNRFEFTFGKISVQESVNQFAASLGGDLSSALGELAVSPDSSLAPGGADVLGEQFAAAPSTATDVGAAGLGGGGGAPPSGAEVDFGSATEQAGGARVALKSQNLAAIGGLTAAAGVAIIGSILLLIGVVRSLATGGPLKIPGL